MPARHFFQSSCCPLCAEPGNQAWPASQLALFRTWDAGFWVFMLVHDRARRCPLGRKQAKRVCWPACDQQPACPASALLPSIIVLAWQLGGMQRSGHPLALKTTMGLANTDRHARLRFKRCMPGLQLTFNGLAQALHTPVQLCICSWKVWAAVLGRGDSAIAASLQWLHKLERLTMPHMDMAMPACRAGHPATRWFRSIPIKKVTLGTCSGTPRRQLGCLYQGH